MGRGLYLRCDGLMDFVDFMDEVDALGLYNQPAFAV